jgi:hypothetical protein
VLYFGALFRNAHAIVGTGSSNGDHPPVSIEVLIPTTRTLGGATSAVLRQLLGPGFANIDRSESDSIEAELTNVDSREWGEIIPDDKSPQELGEMLKEDKEILRVRIPLRYGHFLLFPGFVVLCRPDEYEEFAKDPRARQIVGREALELATAFGAAELIVAGDAATDFLGTDATDWESLKSVLVEEEIPHTAIQIPS